MKTSVIMANYNEWTSKWDVFAGLEGDPKINMNEQHTLLVSNDNWQTYQVDKYKVVEIDIPEWFCKGIVVKMRGEGYPLDKIEESCKERTVKLWFAPFGKNIESLTYKTGKFADSLKEWFASHGYLTGRQIDALNKPYRRSA